MTILYIIPTFQKNWTGALALNFDYVTNLATETSLFFFSMI